MAAPAHVFLGWPDASDYSDATLGWASYSCSDHGVTHSLPFAFLKGDSQASYLTFDFSTSSLTEGWLFTWIDSPTEQDDAEPLLLLSGPTSDLFRLVADGTGSITNLKAQYYNGSWNDIGSLSVAPASSVRSRIDIHWNIADSGGEFTVYIGQTLALTTTGDTKYTADTTVDTATFTSPDGIYQLYLGPVVVDSVDTRGLTWSSVICTSNGTYTEWSQDEPFVDNPVGGDATGLESQADADGERFTLNFPAINATLDSYTPELVCIAIESEATTNDPLYVKPLVRISSTDYNPAEAGSVQPIPTYESVYFFKMENDPSTGSPWASHAAIEGAEMGVEASSTA